MRPPGKQMAGDHYRPSGREPDDDEEPLQNLWVGNLSLDTVDSDLVALFAKYGAMDSVTTFPSRNYAFVYFKNPDAARAARDALQGTLVRGNPIKLEFARPVRFLFTCV
uniref:Flowering time control protein FPA n=1 Tax=Anthurium amnicola TaxID=1678845 RepID=A0A1D1Z6B2_9ARAE